MRPVNDVYISGLQCWPTVIDTAACFSLFPPLSRRRLVSSREGEVSSARDRDSFPRKREHSPARARPLIIINNESRCTEETSESRRESASHGGESPARTTASSMTRLARRNLSSLAGHVRGESRRLEGDGGNSGASHGGAISRVRCPRQRTFLRNRYDLSSVDYIRSHPRGPLVGVGRAWKSPCPAPFPGRRGNHGVVVAAIARIRRSAQSPCAIEGLALHRAGSGTMGWAHGESRGAAPNFNDTRYADTP